MKMIKLNAKECKIVRKEIKKEKEERNNIKVYNESLKKWESVLLN